MKRLTTDDKNSIVFSFNTFYAKDREIWIRGGGPAPDYQDVTLVQWIRSAASKHGLAITADDPECLGDEMYDALQDGDETVEGILALMHLAAVQATEMRERLKPIEDILGDDYDLDRLRELIEADREGRCTVLPCKASDVTVYQLRKKRHALGPGVHPRHVYCATVWSNGRYQLEHQGFEPCRDRDFGKTWFLDEDAANAALKGGNDG